MTRRVVGTAEGCDLRVSDAPYMSSRHFAIETRDDGSVVVEDMGSTNGTDVYNPMVGWLRARFSPVVLVPGGKILAGRMLFKFGTDGSVNVVRDVDMLKRDRA